jgi:hypothetical protein
MFDEQTVPEWLPVLFLLIPVAIMTMLGRTALRRRGRDSDVRRRQGRTRGDSGEHGTSSRPETDDGDGTATMLGLRSKVSGIEPDVFWGTREQGQVFIRLGPVRAVTVLRVDAPAFALTGDGGRLVPSAESPPAITALVAGMAADDVTWGSTHVCGGAEGIVAWRGMPDAVENAWLYDLWLCERIARALELPPLAPARIGSAWTIPYGLERDFSSRS